MKFKVKGKRSKYYCKASLDGDLVTFNIVREYFTDYYDLQERSSRLELLENLIAWYKES